ncbi:N-6 DNA methylase [Pseudoramibacter sp. HA2172]|uniref:N-6 DNA methylase n=1 Tax=Pseudoramibacter faecis TaxID=3108534 RepID=UPI002E79B5B2|nr:N-6 DNA methylase [Pseudoramibacter sp. HA2172]
MGSQLKTKQAIQKCYEDLKKEISNLEAINRLLALIVARILSDRKILSIHDFLAHCPTLPQVMACWKQDVLKADEDWGASALQELTMPLPNSGGRLLRDPSLCLAPAFLGDYYQWLIPKTERQTRGIFYTPSDLAELMASHLAEARCVLDPACGAGSLLSAVYDFQMARCMDESQRDRHRTLLKDNLWGMDMDPAAAWLTRCRLALKSSEYVYPQNILIGDALFSDKIATKEFDGVIVNPPYMGHRWMPFKRMAVLRERYSAVYGDKGDLAYCFFALAHRVLKPKGRAVFLTSRYFMEAQNGESLRRFLTQTMCVEMLMDFYGYRPMRGIGIDPMISVMVNHARPKSIVKIFRRRVDGKPQSGGNAVRDKRQFDRFSLPQASLNAEGWHLLPPATKTIIQKIEAVCRCALGEVAASFQGVITGCDAAFISRADVLPADCASWPCTASWIKNRQVDAFQIAKPAMFLINITDEEDLMRYPAIKDKLTPYRDRLEKRRECRLGKIPWYALQWPRNKKNFESPKIVFPYKAEKNRFALDKKGLYFSADVYGIRSEEIPLAALTVLLNTPIYDFYFKTVAKKLGDALFEYYPNTLMRLKLPSPDNLIFCKLKNLYDIIMNAENTEKSVRLRQADLLLAKAFNLTAFELEMIENRYARQFF